jgi:quercetin dioxygenase-like cupin family protein
LILSLHEHRAGTRPLPGHRVAYDLERGEASFGTVGLDGHGLVWELSEYGADGALLAADVSLDRGRAWLMRCDQVEFPPGGVAYRHVHPGPGIRYLLHGALTIEAEGERREYRAGQAWFEDAEYPVLATAGEADTAFVRVLVVPEEWAGRRTIRYLDSADEAKPKLQRATVLLEERVVL